MRTGPLVGTAGLLLLTLFSPAAGQEQGDPPIAQLVTVLRGENAAARRTVSRAICLLPLRVPEMKDALEARADDDDPVVALRCRATLALWGLSQNEHHRELREMLLSEDMDTRVKAARQLRNLREKAAPAVAELVTALGSPERAPREEAAAALDAIGPAAADAVPALITLYRVTQGSYVVTQALEGIHRGLLRATPLLLAELSDPMASVRQAVLGRLSRNGSAGEQVTEAVRAAYDDPRTRVSAVCTLAAVAPEDPRTIDLLEEALTDVNERVREVAARSLGELGLLAEPAVPALVERLDDESPVVRRRAADALGRVGRRTDSSIKGLVRALDEKNGRVVHAATRSLARLGPPAAALPRLTELTRTGKDWERAWAKAALWCGLAEEDRSVALTVAVATDWQVAEFREEALATLRGMAGGPRAAELAERFCVGYPEPLWSALSAMPGGAPGPGELDAFLRAAEAPEGSGYIHAFDRIAAYGPRAAPAVGTLVAILLADDADRSARAAHALGAIGPAAAKNAVPALLAVMARGDCREAAADALARMGPLVRPLLAEILRTGRPEGAAPFAARALGGMGRHGFPVAPLLLARARTGDMACVEALGRLAPLEDHDATNRVVRALALLLDAGYEELSFFPEETRPIVDRAFRIAVIRCFGEIGYDAGQAAGTLNRLLKSDDDLLRVEAAAAIKRIAGVTAYSDPILDVLIAAAKRSEEDPGGFRSLWNQSRFVAIEALGDLGARRATPLLYRILEDETEGPVMRSAAYAALAKIWGE